MSSSSFSTPYYQPFSTTNGSADRYGIIITVAAGSITHSHTEARLAGDVSCMALLYVCVRAGPGVAGGDDVDPSSAERGRCRCTCRAAPGQLRRDTDQRAGDHQARQIHSRSQLRVAACFGRQRSCSVRGYSRLSHFPSRRGQPLSRRCCVGCNRSPICSNEHYPKPVNLVDLLTSACTYIRHDQNKQ